MLRNDGERVFVRRRLQTDDHIYHGKEEVANGEMELSRRVLLFVLSCCQPTSGLRADYVSPLRYVCSIIFRA
eukprot:4725427-Pyramimonas_sp.AAC.1